FPSGKSPRAFNTEPLSWPTSSIPPGSAARQARTAAGNRRARRAAVQGSWRPRGVGGPGARGLSAGGGRGGGAAGARGRGGGGLGGHGGGRGDGRDRYCGGGRLRLFALGLHVCTKPLRFHETVDEKRRHPIRMPPPCDGFGASDLDELEQAPVVLDAHLR